MSQVDQMIRPVNSFGYQTLVGRFEPTVESMLPSSSHFGLTQESIYIWGTLVAEDGAQYTILRRMYWDYSPHLFPVVQTNEQGGCLMPHPIAAELYQGIMVQKVEGGAHRMISVNPVAKHGFEITRTPETVRWIEGDVVEIEGSIVGSGMQWYSPDAEHPASYLSHLHYCEGTAFGKEVRGFVAFDATYLPRGVNWNTAKYYAVGLGDWFSPATLYDDGSMEVGHVCWPKRDKDTRWAFCMLQNQDEAMVMTNNVALKEQVVSEDGFPKKILLDVDGVDYEWVTKPDGEMHFAKLIGAPFRGADGCFSRVGDSRKVVVARGFLDFYAHYDGDSSMV